MPRRRRVAGVPADGGRTVLTTLTARCSTALIGAHTSARRRHAVDRRAPARFVPRRLPTIHIRTDLVAAQRRHWHECCWRGAIARRMQRHVSRECRHLPYESGCSRSFTPLGNANTQQRRGARVRRFNPQGPCWPTFSERRPHTMRTRRPVYWSGGCVSRPDKIATPDAARRTCAPAKPVSGGKTRRTNCRRHTGERDSAQAR